jgi:hypothetical protein
MLNGHIANFLAHKGHSHQFYALDGKGESYHFIDTTHDHMRDKQH